MKLQTILNRLQKLHPKEIDLSLDRVKNLCKKLGDPQKKLKYISVVGTNGKYSTILLLLTGMIVENIKFLRINTLSITYLVGLLPSIALMPDVEFNYLRQMISANLSGPLCLFISFIYLLG